MASKDTTKQPITFLKSSLEVLFTHPVIFFPFCVLAFIQVLILEVLFFAHRQPLVQFFGPIIKRMEGEVFFHYPFNFTLLNKWFQHVQIPVFVIFSSLFVGVAVAIIDLINKDKNVKLKAVFTKVFSKYIHLIVYALISVFCIIGFGKVYGLVIKRALVIRSTAGIFFLIKKAILLSAPYVNLLFAIFMTTLFAFVVPLIIIGKKNIFSALVTNFKMLLKSFWFVFAVMLLPTLLYIPVLLLKTNNRLFQDVLPPESWGLILILGVFITLFIDAIQVTAVTMYYLLKKEQK